MSGPIIARDALTLACLLEQSPDKMALWVCTQTWHPDKQQFKPVANFWVCSHCFNDNTWFGPRERENFFRYGITLSPMALASGRYIGCHRSASVLT